MDTITLGDVTVTRVQEWEGLFAPPEVLIPDSDPALWAANRSWLDPAHWDAGANMVHAALQTWVLRSAGKTILVDTGAGNGKPRPNIAVFSDLQSPYLDVLAAAGVRPEDVDVVVNTHVHIDHVGWNTVLRDGEWVPTFPYARYVMSAADVDFWDPAHSYERRGEAVNENMFADSVAPVLRAGLVDQWEDSLVLDENLRLDLAPGHTPGLGVLTLASGTDRAVFVGDMLHSPVQVLDPDGNSCFCEDQAEAVRSRRRVLGWAADNTALVFPAHFSGARACEVGRDGSAFGITSWAGFDA